MSASRKTLLKLIRKRALDIHQRNGCPTSEPCPGPTAAEKEQAAREVMRADHHARRRDGVA